MTTDQDRRAQFISAGPFPVITITCRAYDHKFVVAVDDVPVGVAVTRERAERLADNAVARIERQRAGI